jgi:hypothetical protein
VLQPGTYRIDWVWQFNIITPGPVQFRWDGVDPEPALNGTLISFVNNVGGLVPWTMLPRSAAGSLLPAPNGTFTGGLIQIAAPNTVFQFINNSDNTFGGQQVGPCYLIITQLQ